VITWLPRRVLPVLMYHRIGKTPEGEDPALWLPVELFEQHLDWIRAAGFATLTLDEAYAAFARRLAPRRQVLLTFDDAFAETLETALPLLDARGMTAATFVAAECVGREAQMAPAGRSHGPLGGSRGQVADRTLLLEWRAAGHGIGAHSATHVRLDGCPSDILRRETVTAKSTLEGTLGSPILDFCYPYARHDVAARLAVKTAGFRAAYAGEPPTLDLFALPRMMVYPRDDRSRLRRKLSGLYYFLSAWHLRSTPPFRRWRP
jgi:peptidoglycan/xylan/chitin deacetylase (PgdA/CDA1 family)